jgi:hypothetical protein
MTARAQAKAAGELFYEGRPCRRGHTRRSVSEDRCAECRIVTRSAKIPRKRINPASSLIENPAPPKDTAMARYSLASMWRRSCPTCGPESLFRASQCVSCGHDTNAKRERRLRQHKHSLLIAPIAAEPTHAPDIS